MSLFFKYSKLKYNSEHKHAVNDILSFIKSTEKYYGLYGYAGSGKTTLIAEIMKYVLFKSFVNFIVFSAPTNKAVHVLQSKCIIDDKYKKNVAFSTIHRIFGYSADFNIDGEKIFVKKRKKKQKSNIIVIDECSMISKELAEDIFDVDSKILNNSKIIFVGDPSQLPPVNEVSSVIFENDLIHCKTTLKEIVRNTHEDVNDLWTSVREWVLFNKKLTKIKKDNNIEIFKKTDVKTKSKWFYTYMDNIKKDKSAIILTWTNKQTDEYNNVVRQLIFNSDKKYIVNDVLVFTDFYVNDENIPSYTSEQIKILNTSIYDKKVVFNESKYSDKIIVLIVNLIMKRLKMKYKIWKLTVKLMNEEANEYKIDVLHEDSKDDLDKDKELAFNIIKRLSKERKISNQQVKLLWKIFNELLVDIFASVNYGYSITTHKSQGSTYTNVFIDVDDILNNKNEADAKRCLYTALTRSSNKLYLLV